MTLWAPMAFMSTFFVLASPFDGAPGVEVIKISIDKSCRHDKVKLTTVRQKDQDVLVWRIQNDCPTARSVLICVRPAPPLRCSGDPEAAKIGTQFQIGAGQGDKVRAYIICTVKWPPEKQGYQIDVISGPATANLTCPVQEDYELALEVVP